MSYRDLIVNQLKMTETWFEEVPGSDWIKTVCHNTDHIDKNPSAGINVDTGIHHCFSCQYNFMYVNEDQSDPDVIWKAKYQNLKKTIEQEYSDYDAVYEPIMDRRLELVEPPVGHLLNEEWRGLSTDLLSDCKAYYCDKGKYRGRYIFPVMIEDRFYGFDGRVVDASASMIGAKWVRPRGMAIKDIVYPHDVLQKRFTDLSHIVIAEGVADALSYIQIGVPAIASFGLAPPSSKRIEALIRLGVQRVTLAFDNDLAGLTGMQKLLPVYSEWFDVVPHPMVTMVASSNYKDANEFLVGIKQNGLKKTYADEEF